jgi:hypothetical protein
VLFGTQGIDNVAQGLARLWPVLPDVPHH